MIDRRDFVVTLGATGLLAACRKRPAGTVDRDGQPGRRRPA